MFGITTSCACEMVNKLPEAELPWDIITESIGELDEDRGYGLGGYLYQVLHFWSIVHGLVSINLLDRGNSDEINRQVLRDAITGIIRSITP
jgi:hypothetical protein